MLSLRFSCFDLLIFFFFFNDTATTEIYTLSLHDALPISIGAHVEGADEAVLDVDVTALVAFLPGVRSEEHTSELQSLAYLVCRLLLEKKKSGPESRNRSPCCSKSRNPSFTSQRTVP